MPTPAPEVVHEAIKKEIDEAVAELQQSKKAQDWAKKAEEDGFRSLKDLS